MTSSPTHRKKERQKKRDTKVKKKWVDNDKVKNEGALVYVYANSLVYILHLLPLPFFCYFLLPFRISYSGEDLHFFHTFIQQQDNMLLLQSGKCEWENKIKRNHKTFQALFLEVKVWLQTFITEYQVLMAISTLVPWL